MSRQADGLRAVVVSAHGRAWRGSRAGLCLLGGIVAALALCPGALAAPLGQASDFATPTTGSGPAGITVGPGRQPLVHREQRPAGSVRSTRPPHAITEFPIPTAVSGPVGITAGPDGNLWFTEDSGNKIGEINPTTHAITEFADPDRLQRPVRDHGRARRQPLVHRARRAARSARSTRRPTPSPSSRSPPPAPIPIGITAGPDGNLWFTEHGVNKIGEINPTTHAITEFAGPDRWQRP